MSSSPTAPSGAPAIKTAHHRLAGAVGVHIGGTACRAAADFDSSRIQRRSLPPGGVDAICEAVVAAVRGVEERPRFVVVGTPGHVDRETGTVAGAANLGAGWEGSVPLGALLKERLGCPVAVRNDAEAALEAEKRRGGLVAINDGALITLGTGVGIAMLVDGQDRPTELGHSVLQFGGPQCVGRPHRGCFESYLGGWALPLRYKERHPEFTGSAAREIPDDPEFWTECGERLAELVLTLCLLGQPLEVVSVIGAVALAREQYLLPPVAARLKRESTLLSIVPRRVLVTPLGEDVAVIGALLIARDLLHPFQDE